MYMGSWYCGKWRKFNGENKWFKDGPPALSVETAKIREN